MKKLLISLILFACTINIYCVFAQNDIILADNIYGDVDGNGKVDTKDYIMVRKMILSLIGKTNNGDVNQDGIIDTKDYVVIRKIILGLLKESTNTSTPKPIEKKDDKITITAKTATYTGKGVAATATATSGTAVTLTYYSDSSCKTKTTTTNATAAGGTPKNVGTYYAIGTTTGNLNYKAGKSACTKAVVITAANDKIHFIKVCTTSGDAILLESNGHYALIDTGCSNTKADVYNYLKDLGVTKLDFILITHNHADHRGAAKYLIGKYKSNVGKFYTKEYDGSANSQTQRESFKKILDDIIATCKENNIPVSYINKDFIDGGKITLGNMTIKLYNTQHYIKNKDYPTYSTNDNTNSVLELITVNGYKVLLTGDLYDAYMNRWLLADLSKKSEFKNIDVLKMPHHGYTTCAFRMGDTTKKDIGWNFGKTSMSNLSPDHIIVTNSKAKGNACASAAGGSTIPRYFVNEDGVKAIVVNLKKGSLSIKTVKQS